MNHNITVEVECPGCGKTNGALVEPHDDKIYCECVYCDASFERELETITITFIQHFLNTKEQ